MRKPISVVHEGKKIRAVGSRIYVVRPSQTFHQFCIHIVGTDFGKHWYQDERAKPETERHIVANWYTSYCDFTKAQSSESKKVNGVWSALPSGDVWSLVTLGYDLYSIRHNTENPQDFPDELISRMKNRSEFQGARYEVAVAAIFARFDFNLTYVRSKSTKHWEFNARHKVTGEVVAVEAKSRHRPGVLHEPGQQLSLDATKVGVARVLNQALEQKPDRLPFVVFIDLNLPLASDVPHPGRKWWKDLERAIELQSRPTASAPTEFNALFVTNFSCHYAKKKTVDADEYAADSSLVIPRYSRIPFRDNRTLRMIDQEAARYGYVPHGW